MRPWKWTNLLHATGAEVVGIDPVAAFIADVQARYPQVDYRLGRSEQLDVTDASVTGILAWCSLIHTSPRDVGAVLRLFEGRIMRAQLLCLFVVATSVFTIRVHGPHEEPE